VIDKILAGLSANSKLSIDNFWIARHSVGQGTGADKTSSPPGLPCRSSAIGPRG